MKTLMSLVFTGLLCVNAQAAEMEAAHLLMVVTSHGQIDPQTPTGLWLEEFAVPYAVFRNAGYAVTVASPLGGRTPVDPRSLEGEEELDPKVMAILGATRKLADLSLEEFDAVFFAGGHGTMFDLPSDEAVARTVSHFLVRHQPTAFVCHGPAALVGAVLPDGSPAVAGRRITAFTNEEERAVELADEMPFLLESRLRELGAEFVGAEKFEEHLVVDGNLITGQNPPSSRATANAVRDQVEAARSARALAQKVALAHGINAWPEVAKIAFTFEAQLGETTIARSWMWEPGANRVTLVDEGITYTRDQNEAFAETDAKFINDEYWLVFPFHLLWDDVALTRSTEPEPVPGGTGTAIRLTVQYPAEGGYTPGDAYDLYLHPDHTVRAWVFRKGGATEPTRITAWEDYVTVMGLRISQNRPGPDPASFRISFSGLSVE